MHPVFTFSHRQLITCVNSFHCFLLEYPRTTDPVSLCLLPPPHTAKRNNKKSAEQGLFATRISLLPPAVAGLLGLELRLLDREETGEDVWKQKTEKTGSVNKLDSKQTKISSVNITTNCEISLFFLASVILGFPPRPSSSSRLFFKIPVQFYECLTLLNPNFPHTPKASSCSQHG